MDAAVALVVHRARALGPDSPYIFFHHPECKGCASILEEVKAKCGPREAEWPMVSVEVTAPIAQAFRVRRVPCLLTHDGTATSPVSVELDPEVIQSKLCKAS